MARILYGMAGEGRGHAVRARTVVEALRPEHELILLAPDEAYDFLAPLYPPGTPNVFVRRIAGLRFHYQRSRLNLSKSVKSAAAYWWRLPHLVAEIGQLIDQARPDLAITDFEPAVARAARSRGVPLVSLDHQHFLLAYDLSSLPLLLRGVAGLMGLAVRGLRIEPSLAIISAFFRPPLCGRWSSVLQVGPILRPELRRLRPATGSHIVSYLRKTTPPHVLVALATAGCDVHVYGLGERRREGCLVFRPIHEQAFAQDLASCAAVVGAAGNQTLGESLFLGKPVLALPEGQHHEQRINAHFLEAMGAGEWTTMESFAPSHLRRFLARLDHFQAGARAYLGKLDGTADALAAIERYLPRPPRKCVTPALCAAASIT